LVSLFSNFRLALEVPAIAGLEQMTLVGICLLLLKASCSVTFVLSLVGWPLHKWLEYPARTRLDWPVAAVVAGAALSVVAVVELGSVLLLVQWRSR
jgi:hypothetical protein